MLLNVELQKFNNDGYKAEVLSRFTGDDAEHEYLESVKQEIDSVADSEAATMGHINTQIGLGLTPENFVDHILMQSLDGANAFPDFSSNIVKDLIGPSQYLTEDINTHYTKSKDYFRRLLDADGARYVQ